MIIKTLSKADFVDEFNFGEQSSYNEQFTYEGLSSLYDYIMECYDEENPFEIDAIALIVQFSEYDSLEECLQEVGNDDIKTMEELQHNTSVIEVEGTERIIISEF